MKQSLTFNGFHDAFRAYDRLDNFSYDGLKALFDWFEDMEENDGEQVELDVIGICCEFTEEHWSDIADNYSIDLPESGDDIYARALNRLAVEDYIDNNTLVVSAPDSGDFVYVAF